MMPINNYNYKGTALIRLQKLIKYIFEAVIESQYTIWIFLHVLFCREWESHIKFALQYGMFLLLVLHVQHKIFKGCKSRGFLYFSSKRRNYISAKMNGQLIVWLNNYYACNSGIFFFEIKNLINPRNLQPTEYLWSMVSSFLLIVMFVFLAQSLQDQDVSPGMLCNEERRECL